MHEIEFENNIYQISFEAMPESLKKSLASQELKHYLQLLQAVQQTPKKVYIEIKSFAEKHSGIPEVLNLLTFAHIQNFRIAEAENLIEKTYFDHPEYFFARVNFADQCIRKRMLEKVTQIFPTFDLQKLYPGKKAYHTSEFRGFLIMASYYHLALKNREKVLHYFKAAKETEPQNPNVIFLEKKLFRKSLLRRLLGNRPLA